MLVQSFAARAWTLTTVLCGALFFGSAVGGAALPGGFLRAAALYVVIFFIGLTTIAGIAMWLVVYRGTQTRHYVLRGGPVAASVMAKPEGGQPKTRDFWIGLLVMAVFFGGFLYLEARYH